MEIAVVDDDPSVLEFISDVLQEQQLRTRGFTDPRLAWDYLKAHSVPLVITDWEMPHMSGLDLLFRLRGLEKSPHVIILTGHGSIERAVQAMAHGAHTFLLKPFAPAALLDEVKKILDAPPIKEAPAPASTPPSRKSEVKTPPVVEAESMQRVYAAARKAAGTDSSILILGESGTGKEVLVDFIHEHSARGRGPIVKVNCGAIPESLIESELFGHEKGAFTGADRRRVGKFEQANGGTLFLDEIGDLQPPLQVKLLRAIQERVIERVGSETPLPIDFRLVCATHRNLQDSVRAGSFREDLFYRINVVPLRLPPLRERVEEIEPLARSFLKSLGRKTSDAPTQFSQEAIVLLKSFPWPGNVRQLKNSIEYATVMCRGAEIGIQDLPEELRFPPPAHTLPSSAPAAGAFVQQTPPAGLPPSPALSPTATAPLGNAMQGVEAQLITDALKRSKWNVSKVAKDLGISRSTLYEKMNLYGIKRTLDS